MAELDRYPVHRRTILTAILAGLFADRLAAAAPCRPTRVLFVCPVGTVKSAIARETLRRRVAASNLPVLVQSRGIAPANHVTPALAERLHADAIDPTVDPLRALTAADVANADIVIAFDEAAQSPLLAKARAWRTPSWNDQYDAAKADLAQRLDGLIEELARTPAC